MAEHPTQAIAALQLDGAGVSYDFGDSVVLVTGGARGMGRDIARRFAGFGAAVVVSDVAGPVDALGYDTAAAPDLDETVAEIRAAGAEANAVAADVRNEEQVAALIAQTIDRYGRLDILVNNAGVYTGAPVTELTEEQWDAAVDTNLKGPFLCSKHAARHMKSRDGGGRIITVSSTSALVGIPNQASYSRPSTASSASPGRSRSSSHRSASR
jgi:NAD(P)-dependent dehydrogenase (short-subunit alcohol dehydrogenase family)